MENYYNVCKKISLIFWGCYCMVFCIAFFGACNDHNKNAENRPVTFILPDEPDSAWLQIIKDTLLTMKTEMEQINYLRNFAYKTTDWGVGEVNTTQLLPGKQLSLTQYYYLFKNDLGGVYCGGASQYLSQLYQYFGFESHTYDMGGNNQNSHVVTLVKANRNWYIRDAIFYVTYLHVPDSTELDFCSLMQLLIEGKHDSVIVYQQPDLPTTDFLYNSDSTINVLANIYDYCSIMENYEMNNTLTYISNSHAKIKWVMPRNINMFMHIDGNKYADFLQQHNKPMFFVYLFMFPKNPALTNIVCPNQ